VNCRKIILTLEVCPDILTQEVRMEFTAEERLRLQEMKIPRQLIYLWRRGGGINIRYLPQVAAAKRITVSALVEQLLEEKRVGGS